MQFGKLVDKAMGVKTVGDLGGWKYASRAAALVALAELGK